MSEEEKIATDGGENPSAEPVVNDSATPAKVEDSVDEQVKEILGDIPTVEETEKPGEKPAASQPEEEKGNPEKVVENTVVQQPENPQNSSIDQPSRLERRIAKLYQSNRILRGEEGDVDIEQVIAEIKNYPLAEKTKALKNLLSEQRSLRTGQNDGVVDLSEDDHAAIIEAEVDNRLQEMQGEIQAREWNEDLIKTVDAHPELNEQKNEYNPKIAIAVEKLAQKGMKVSEAYELVTDSISVAKNSDEKSAELGKQRLLSGAVPASNENVAPKGKLTWEELARRQEANPGYVNSEEYLKLAREGKLPTE